MLLNKGGIVRNTVFDHNTCYSSGGNNSRGHHIVFYYGGLVESCKMTCGGLPYNASSSGGVHFRQGGTLRNSLVATGTTGHTGSANATGIEIQSGGTIENCTVAGNVHSASTDSPGVYIWNNGTVEIKNSIIYGNSNAAGNLDVVVSGTPSMTVANTCSTYAFYGVDNITDDPSFVNAAGGDFSLGLSPAVNAGKYLDWMEYVPCDVAGNDRVTGDAPDMGCYEFAASGLTCGFSVNTAGDIGTDTVTLTSLVAGDADGVSYKWTLTDQAGNVTVTNGSELATLVIGMPAGKYNVKLEVTNGASQSASAEKPEVFVVSPAEEYVATDGGNVYPYDISAKAATNLTDALVAAGNGTVIHVGPGWHRTADTLNVNKGVKIISDEGRDRTFFFTLAQTGGMPMLLISHADAVVSGFTITGKEEDGTQVQKWGGVRITADGGTITNCVICNNLTQNISVHGSGARMEGGTVVDSLFTNNFTQCSGGGGMCGGAIYMTGANALVDRCVVATNTVSYGGTSYGGGIYLNAGMIRNSLLIGNYCVNYGGGAAVTSSGKLVYCTLVGNSSGTGSGGIWQNGGTVSDCLVFNNTANGVAEDTDDPGFVNATEGNYHLSGASAAVDAGTYENAGDYDLDLKPRRGEGSKPDKGCYEYDPSQFEVSIAFEKLTPFEPGTVRFTASIMPRSATLDAEASYWTFDGREPTEADHDAVGAEVEHDCPCGNVTVRFKTVYKGETYTVDKPDWFTAYGQTVYLVTENPNAAFPYATAATAATNIEEAAACMMDNATLLIADGTYPIKSTWVLTKANRITSVNGPEKTILDCGYRCVAFNIQNSAASVDGVTVSHGLTWDRGGAVTMTKGTVSNCWFEACQAKNTGGGAIYANGGNSCIVDCRFRNSSVWYAASLSGSAISVYGSGVLIDRCIIEDSYVGYETGKSTLSKAYGAIYLENGSSTVRNTVIAGSVDHVCSGIYFADNSSATVVNCTVLGGIGNVKNAGLKIVNTIADSVSGADASDSRFDHCFIGGDPKLRNHGKLKYRPVIESPVRAQGVVQKWMKDATDVYGEKRLAGKNRVSIGAAEPHGFPFSILFR